MSIEEVIDCLNKERIRATYGAVGAVLGCSPHPGVQARLQDWNQKRGLPPEFRHPETSWVVNGTTEKPTGYTAGEEHSELYLKKEIIRTGPRLTDLLKRCAQGPI